MARGGDGDDQTKLPSSGPEFSFFRIVKTSPATAGDFLSAQAKGRRFGRYLPVELHRLWDGLSVYATFDQAARKARQSPMIGRYIAELRIVEGGPIRFERTTREPGHHTLWGDPSALLRAVVRVRPVADTGSEAKS